MPPTRRSIAIAILIPFVILTIYAVAVDGYLGLIEFQLRSPAGWQVLADLCVSLVLVLTWILPNAKQAGRRAWPWFVATLLAGAIGPLVYLALYGTDRIDSKTPT